MVLFWQHDPRQQQQQQQQPLYQQQQQLHLSAEVWGPHYWFFLHTVAIMYPEFPTETTKRKYYDLVTNMPLFIPDEEIGNEFAATLDEFPVTPYLVNRESFMRWVNFVHNHCNRKLGKQGMPIFEATQRYLAQYHPRQGSDESRLRLAQQIGRVLYLGGILAVTAAVGWFVT